MSKTKIGIPNFFSLLTFSFMASGFISGLLLAMGVISPGIVPGLMVVFMFIAWVFSAWVSFSFLRNFKLFVVRYDEIKSMSFFPLSKRTIRFKDLDDVQWGTQESFFDNTVKYVYLHHKNGEKIYLSDMQLENFDSIMESIPHKNSKSKTRVYKEQAKDEFFVMLSLVLVSLAAFVFLEYKWNHATYFLDNTRINDFEIEDLFIRVLFPLVHLIFIWAATKRFVKYAKVLHGKKTRPKSQQKARVQEHDFIKGFEYGDDRLMGYFSGAKKLKGQEYHSEVYFYAPKEEVLLSQNEQLNQLEDNLIAIKDKLENELHRLLKLENFEYLDKVLSEPLSFSIISILHAKSDHENIKRDHDIELICTKTYKNSPFKKDVEIFATLSDGKIISMERP